MHQKQVQLRWWATALALLLLASTPCCFKTRSRVDNRNDSRAETDARQANTAAADVVADIEGDNDAGTRRDTDIDDEMNANLDSGVDRENNVDAEADSEIDSGGGIDAYVESDADEYRDTINDSGVDSNYEAVEDATIDVNSDEDTAVPTCVPGRSVSCTCVDGQSGAQVCEEDGFYGPCECNEESIGWFQEGIIGTWGGTFDNPWEPQKEVHFEFRTDGTFTSSCSPDCISLYWGTDNDMPDKKYGLTYTDEADKAYGWINLVWDDGTVIRVDMVDVAFTQDRNSIDFAIWRESYGPLEYALERESG